MLTLVLSGVFRPNFEKINISFQKTKNGKSDEIFLKSSMSGSPGFKFLQKAYKYCCKMSTKI
jgi:hypothetical protein